MSQKESKKKGSGEIDKVLKDLYDSAKEFNDKLQVAKEMVKLEMARLKQEESGEGGEGLKDD